MFVDIPAIFLSCSGSYISPLGINKTISEIIKLTSAAIIHIISPSLQQDQFVSPIQSCTPSVLFTTDLSPFATFPQTHAAILLDF